MDFNKYQEKAISTAIYPNIGHNLIYPVLGLCGESGEVAEKVKKIIRDSNGIVNEDRKNELVHELGDVLWYLANIAEELEVRLGTIATKNVEKIQSRKQRNKITGNGDNR